MENLYQFPLVETKSSLSVDDFKTHPLVKDFFSGQRYDFTLYNETEIIHKLSHQHLHTKFWIIEVDTLPEEGIYITELHNYPTPVLISNFLNDFNFPV